MNTIRNNYFTKYSRVLHNIDFIFNCILLSSVKCINRFCCISRRYQKLLKVLFVICYYVRRKILLKKYIIVIILTINITHFTKY